MCSSNAGRSIPFRYFFLFLLISPSETNALRVSTSTFQKSTLSYSLSITPRMVDTSNVRQTSTRLNVQIRPPSSHSPSKRRPKCNPCEQYENSFNNNDNDVELDRREAAFAMMGNLWSRGLLPSALLSSAFTTTTLFTEPASAIYGTDAKMDLPNIMENMSNRVNKQCLVESLGNRDCLVYMDPDNQLYKGADTEILLSRLETSSMALATIPNLVQEKKWSKVRGVITGPMGSLLSTMNDLSKLSSSPDKTSDLAKTVKLDLFAISAAVERKNGDLILKYHQSATDNLVAFVNAL